MIALLLNRYVIGAVLAALIVTGAYVKGRSDCNARWEYASIQAQRDELLNLIKTEKAAREADAQRMAENADLLRDLQEKAEEDAKTLEDATRECFSRDDTLRLRQHFRKAP